MENQYHKEYPQLMAGKKIMYVHGFASSAQSGTVELLRTLMPGAEIIAEDLPLDPADAISLLQEMCGSEHPDLVIGSSAGGMMSEMLYGYDRILMNPAFQMGETMLKNNMLGKMTYQNPRKDGVQEFMVTKALVKQYGELTARCFAGAADKDEQRRVWGMFGDNDPVVHTFDLFHSHYRQAVRFHGEHRLIDKVAIHYLIPIVRWIDDRQEGRERPILYITLDAMQDGYGRPRPSMHKAFEMLLEHYNVYFVCPAPTNDHQCVADAQVWIEDVISAPAYDRVIFANQMALLYGDYMISTRENADFMGTGIQLGTDEFKTWDEIIIYFGRLGGQ